MSKIQGKKNYSHSQAAVIAAIGETPRIWKEQRDASIVSNDGFVIKKVEPDSDSLVRRHQKGLFDPNGNLLVDVVGYNCLRDLPWNEVYSYEERTGRSGLTACDIKFGPAHFPKGTIFEVDPMVGLEPAGRESEQYISPAERVVRFTVDKLSYMDVKNFVIVCEEPGRKFSHEETARPFTVSVAHVRRIIKVGNGPLVFDHDIPDGGYLEYSRDDHNHLMEAVTSKYKLKKDEAIWATPGMMVDYVHYLCDELKVQSYGRSLNQQKLFENLTWYRQVKLNTCVRSTGSRHIRGEYNSFYAIIYNKKKLRHLLTKKLHTILDTAKTCRKAVEASDRADAAQYKADMGY
jgi:hypothetical protein